MKWLSWRKAHITPPIASGATAVADAVTRDPAMANLGRQVAFAMRVQPGPNLQPQITQTDETLQGAAQLADHDRQ